MDSLNIVGPQVKMARLASQPPMTQEELATKLQLLGWSCDRFTISKIELGTRQVTDKEVLLLAKALNISITQLLNRDF